jgi:chemotaxis protein MotA
LDIATLIGLIGSLVLIGIAIVISGDFAMFIDIPSVIIVLGGTFFAVMTKFGLAQFFNTGKIAAKSFVTKLPDPNELIAELVKLAEESRKGGFLALEGRKVSHDFLRRGIQLLVDGHDPEVVKSLLHKDKNLTVDRHFRGAQIFFAMAEVAPAMGMIGTLIGLVTMLANMTDPKSIGPAMAVALLTTLYGALIANLIAGPIGDKLKMRAVEESHVKNLVIDGILAIQSGLNPRVIDSMLRNYLPERQREKTKKIR